MEKPLLVIIGGPTGIGKTSTAIELATHFNTEIISADSRQVYKELSIGTAVPTKEELQKVKHHFIQNKSIKERFNASTFEFEAIVLLKSLFRDNKIIFVVGGSGMYIDALCYGIDDLPTIPKEIRENVFKIYEDEGLEKIQNLVKKIDPIYFENVDKNNYKRLLKAIEVFKVTNQPYSNFLQHKKKSRSFDILKIILDTNRETLYNRINERVDAMIDSGLVIEARSVYSKRDLTPLKTVGYRELFEYFDGSISEDEAITQIKNHSRAYARKQLTWFRRYEDAHWFEPKNISNMIELIKKRSKE